MEEINLFLEETLSKEARRGLSVKMQQLGFKSKEIEAVLGVSQQFVSKCKKKYHEAGVSALYSQHQGSKGFLSVSEKEAISVYLAAIQSINIHSFRHYILDTFGVKYATLVSYYQLLDENGFSWHKTSKSNPKKDMEVVLSKREELKKNWHRKKKP